MVSILHLLQPGQLEQVESLAKTLDDYGPWALLVLAMFALAWMAKLYVAARDERDQAMSAINKELTDLLKESVTASERQLASNERVCEGLERLEEEVRACSGK